MTEFKSKNIDDLLSKFYSSEQAEQIKNDFASADAIFEKFPVPNLSGQTTAEIKQKIVQHLESQKPISWTAVLVKTASVAAIVVTFSAVLLLTHTGKDLNQYATNEQQTSSRQIEQAEAGIDVSFFEAEFKLLKNELLTINLGEDNGTNGTLVDHIEKIELEIIETENTFWKG